MKRRLRTCCSCIYLFIFFCLSYCSSSAALTQLTRICLYCYCLLLNMSYFLFLSLSLYRIVLHRMKWSGIFVNEEKQEVVAACYSCVLCQSLSISWSMANRLWGPPSVPVQWEGGRGGCSIRLTAYLWLVSRWWWLMYTVRIYLYIVLYGVVLKTLQSQSLKETSFGKSRHRWEDNIKVNACEVRCMWIGFMWLSDRDQWHAAWIW